jgi:hypothetical protein
MNPSGQDALQAETTFLECVASRFGAARPKPVPGRFFRSARLSQTDQVKAAMARRGLYDRGLLAGLPHNRSLVFHGYQPRLFGLSRQRTGVLVAAALTRTEDLLNGRSDTPAMPITLAELADHIRGLIQDPGVPHVIGVCAPQGFSQQARSTPLEFPNVQVVLVEPGPAGGWRVSAAGGTVPEPLRALFDPEHNQDKIRRVQETIDQRSVELLGAGLSAQELARELALPENVVEEAFAARIKQDPELQCLPQPGGDLLLLRGAPVQEPARMSLLDRIKQRLGLKVDEAKKINALTATKAKLVGQRDRLYEDISKLEKYEKDRLAEGKSSTSPVVRRRVASQVAQLRKEIGRLHTRVAVVNQQINVIATSAHNLTLLQQGKAAQLPTAEELTDQAVRAEELLEELRGEAEMIRTLEATAAEATFGDEEEAILKELEAADAERTAKPARTTPTAEAAPPEPPRRAEPESREPEAT